MMKLLVLVLMIVVSGCESGLRNSCDWAKPIRPKTSDVDVISDSLTRQLLEHNITGQRVCGWRR